MHAFEAFFGTDEMTFYATSSRFPGEQRVFHRFSDLTNEVLEARIWAGIHFRNADVQAANLGREVEDYVHKHQFAFVPQGGKDDHGSQGGKDDDHHGSQGGKDDDHHGSHGDKSRHN